MATGLTLTHTRVAAEGQFPSGCVGLSDVEIPVFVNAHGGGVSVPAGVGKQEVLKARQHLSGMRGDCKKKHKAGQLTHSYIYILYKKSTKMLFWNEWAHFRFHRFTYLMH